MSSPAVIDPPASPEPSRRFLAAAAIIIVSAAVAAWSGSFTGALVFDDVPVIAGNPSIRSLWPPWESFLIRRADLTVSGRPLVNFSFALNYAISAEAVWSYHAANLLIHILAGLALLGILRRTAAAAGLFAGGRAGTESVPTAQTSASDLFALSGALLWTLHPVQTESVTYLVQRVESLMGLFFLLTLYCFIRGTTTTGNLEAGEPAKGSPCGLRGNIWFILSIATCFLGMACKEVMSVAPVVVLLYDRLFLARSFRAALRRRSWVYAGFAASWILLAALASSTAGRGGSAGFGSAVAPWVYALTQCRAVVHYLRLAFWPHPLVFDYGLDVVDGPLAVLPQILLLAALAAATLRALRRWPAAGFAGAWWFLTLAPSSSLVPVATQTMAEHRLYLALAAPVALAAAGIFRLLGPRRGTALCTLLALLLAAATFARNAAYRDESTLWTDTVRKCPGNARAHSNLGSLWLKQGNLTEAGRCFSEALRLQPHYASAHYNLGIVLARTRQPEAAAAHFTEALRIEPDFADARVNLGLILARQGRLPEAVAQYEEALRLQPASADAHVALGLALGQLDRLPEAVGHFESALRLDPGLAAAHRSLADVLAQMGDTGAAALHYSEALRIEPGDSAAHYALGNLHAAAGRFAEAVDEYRAALRTAPDDTAARTNLGNALLVSGRVDEAIAEYQEVLRLRPGDPSARENLEQARALRASPAANR